MELLQQTLLPTTIAADISGVDEKDIRNEPTLTCISQSGNVTILPSHNDGTSSGAVGHRDINRRKRSSYAHAVVDFRMDKSCQTPSASDFKVDQVGTLDSVSTLAASSTQPSTIATQAVAAATTTPSSGCPRRQSSDENRRSSRGSVRRKQSSSGAGSSGGAKRGGASAGVGRIKICSRVSCTCRPASRGATIGGKSDIQEPNASVVSPLTRVVSQDIVTKVN